MNERPPSADPGSGEQSRAPRPPGTFRLGSLGGTDVLVSNSWFLVAAMIAVLMAPRVEQVRPGLGLGTYVAGFAFAVVLYLSVLLHEWSHAAVAKRFGFDVDSITLHFLGGMTAVRGEARTPWQEFAIAVVGPITSVGVGLAALAAWFVTPEGLLQLAVEGLAGANLLIGVLNMVPGLPLDGGRVLKAAVWGVSGNPHHGTTAAGWGGRLAALAVLGWPFAQRKLFGIEPSLFDFLIVGVIAIFLWTGATAALSSAKLRQKLPSIVARDLARRTLAVPEDLSVAEAVRRAQEAEAGSIITVTTGGAPLGIVNEAALLATPTDRRPWAAISTVTRSLDPGLTLPVDIDGEELVRAITAMPAQEYLLMSRDGSVYGVLATADVDEAFRRV